MTKQPDKQKLRILVADDHDIVREGICSLLSLESDIEVVADVADGEAAVQKTKELTPDVVIMDIRMPGLNGVDATRQIKAKQSSVIVLCMSVHHERRIVDNILEAGASGYILKGNAGAELVRAVRAVVAGEEYFCPTIASERAPK